MRIYRALLHAYPASFRAEYGEEMCAVFSERRREAANPLLLLALWIDVFIDTAWNAARVHLDILRQDLRYAARMLRRTPGFALTVVAVSALGIGATTAAFTMVDHVLIRPLPFADSDRLVAVYQNNPVRGAKYWELSPANYRDWKRASTSFESMGCYTDMLVNLTGGNEPLSVSAGLVSAEVFSMLGRKPILGRYFSAEEDRETAPATVVLSYRLWQTRFGGDASVLGRKILIDGQPFTVIGVMPNAFYFPNREVQLWTPLRFDPDSYADRENTYIYPVARLRRGVSLAAAQSEMSLIAARLAGTYPKELEHVGATVIFMRDNFPDRARTMLMALLAAAGCVLLIACTNLANLMLARAMVRRKELAVRAAMGAGRERLVRQMLTESLILALVGGALGILIAVWALPLLVRLVPITLPIAEVPAVDVHVLAFAALITLATGVGFGVIPALRACRGDDTDALRESQRAGGGRRERLRGALVIAEVGGCVVLMVCCGLLMRALWRVQAVDPGFHAEGVLTLRTALPQPKYEKTATRVQFYSRVLSAARRLPGVTGAAYVTWLPMVWGGGVQPVEVADQPADVANRENASLRYVTPGYFSVMGIPLLEGRDAAELDTAQSRWVAVVSASFVRRYWPHQDPIGRRITFAFADRTVVGVVGDIRVRGLERTNEPQIYIPYKQVPDGWVTFYTPKDLAVRVTGDPGALAPALRRIIHEADPEQPVTDIQLLSDVVDAQTAPRAVQLGVLGAFAAIAFLLAAIGIHGLLAFAVSTRTQEIGVRMALGATQSNILAMVIREGVVLAVIGISVGVAIAFAAAFQIRALLAGVPPADALTFAGAVALALLMTVAGSLLPALRAVRVDPTVAIRVE
jgi:putative ABC transport system permease protein